MRLKLLLHKINNKINKHAEGCAYPYITFAIFGIITYPFYYWLWYVSTTTGYDNLSLRLVVVVMCVILALKNYWPEKLQNYFALYWYITLLYCLPFQTSGSGPDLSRQIYKNKSI